MTQAAICPKCGGRGEVQNDDRQFKVCDACKGWGTQMKEDVISPYACDKCNDTGWQGDNGTYTARSVCDCPKGVAEAKRISKQVAGASIPDLAESAASYDPDSLSFCVELSKCAKRINPNGVHAIVRDQAIALETYDLGVSFEEQQKFDLPPQVTILGVLPADVFSQLMMNNIDPSASPDSSTIKFWIDVFQEMGPDYFAALKKLVAKLEWTV